MPLKNETVYEPVPSLTFITNPPTFDYVQGRVYFDGVDDTLAVSQDDDVTLQAGQESQAYVWNNTGADIPNGAAGYANGSLAYRPTVALARADSILTSNVQGMATQAIPKNTQGFATERGLVRGFDTQTPGWNEGDLLYLSDTVAGGLQNTPPTSGYCIIVGRVLRRHPEEGMIYIEPRPLPAFGNLVGGNYTQFEYDGTMRAVGNATCFRDELQSVTGAQITSPAGDFQQNISEASVTAKTSARYPTDYITTNWQLNHDWLLGSVIHPHIHWWQTEADMPNWLLEYRWQKQGSAKTTTWTPQVWTANSFTWTAGTLNQITEFGTVTPPVGYGQVSDIVQIRIYRDVTNVSTLFTGAEATPLDQDIVNLDCHIEVDTLGSRQEYIK